MGIHDENPGSVPDENHDGSNGPDETKNMSESQKGPRIPVSRRGALAALAGISGLTLSSRSGRASHKGPHWKNDVDAGGNTLLNLGELSMAANPTGITNFEGDLLEVDEGGVLHSTGLGISGVDNPGGDVVFTSSDNNIDIDTYSDAVDFMLGESVRSREIFCDILGAEDITASQDITATTITCENLQVSGTKNFVTTVDSAAGPRQITYTSVEAGRPRTEVSDVGDLADGRAVIDLPEHFKLVTSEDEPLIVQLTPYADGLVQPQVVERSLERVVVEDFSKGPDQYSFAYTVKGVRKGFEDEPVVEDAA